MISIRKLFWWDSQPNFGDTLGPVITTRLLSHCLPLAHRGDTDVLFSVGSILHYVPRFRRVVVWGSGIEPHYGVVSKDDLTILALRGPLSRQQLSVDCPVLGDPGLLMPRIYPRDWEPNDVAIIPHHSTMRRRLRDCLFSPFHSGYRIIDPRQPWLDVIDQVCRSRLVFCQSLHGAIIAQAYGVPWVWWKGLHGRVAGFKWHDWFASIGVAPKSFLLGSLRRAERWAANIRPRVPDLHALSQSLVSQVMVNEH